jgi:hypothetical protein
VFQLMDPLFLFTPPLSQVLNLLLIQVS